MTRLRFLFPAFLLVVFGHHAFLQGQEVSGDTDLDSLLKGLGDVDYKVRERASAQLTKKTRAMGKDGIRFVRGALERAEDPEVRMRLESLLRELTRPTLLWDAVVAGNSFYATQPVMAGEFVLFPGRDRLSCLEKATGKEAWSIRGEFAHSRPAVKGNTVVAVHAKGLQALELASGRPLWLLDVVRLRLMDEGGSDAGVTLHDQWAYMSTRNGRLVCADVSTGEIAWASLRCEASLWQPKQAEGRVLACSWGRSLVCFAARSGKKSWEADVPGIGALPPEVTRDRAFVVSYKGGKGGATAVRLRDGKVLWKANLAPQRNHEAVGGPHLVKDTLVITTKKDILGLSPSDGTVRWNVPVARFGYQRLLSDPEGLVYAGTDAGELIILQASDGRVLLRFDLNRLSGAVNAPAARESRNGVASVTIGRASCPALDNGVLTMQTTSGWAVALRLPPLR